MLRASILGLILGLGAPALAAPSDQDQSARVEALAAKARVEYKAGRFVKAVELYREAFGLGGASALLYNIAHIYDRKIGDPELAERFYRQYVSASDADPKAASRATARMQALKRERAEAEAEAGRKDAARRAARAAERPPDPPAVVNRRTDTLGRPLRIAGWTAAGVGVAAIGVGVFFGLGAQDDADAFSASESLADKKSLRDDGEGKALLADVLYGVGGAAVVTGVLLLVLAPDDTPTVGAGPTADGRGGAIWIGGQL